MPPLVSLFSRLRPFHGGLRLPGHRDESADRPVSRPPLPAHLLLPLQPHVQAVVAVSQRVLKGQRLTQADGANACLHAPSSGIVTAIEARPVAHPSGLRATCIVIATDGLDEWHQLPPPISDYRRADPALVRERVRAAGIVELGGAAPTALKLTPRSPQRVELLILNGVECEPYVTCDDRLMRERAHDVIDGLLLLRRALQAAAVVIAVADDQPAAQAALAAALASCHDPSIALRLVPARYPLGDAQQLIRALTGREFPRSGIPADHGIVCHNVATAAAVQAAVATSRPLLSRYVTVTGRGVHRPQVVDALLGTPVAELIAWCGGYTAHYRRLLLGGPMRGFALADDAAPITADSRCILAASAQELAPAAAVMPCIRCGACMEVCPARLLPQQLYRYAQAKNFARMQDEQLHDCSECGCCAAVCPSHISLVQYFRFAKSELQAQQRAKQKADLALRRYQARRLRLEREQQEKTERLHRKEALTRTPTAGREDLQAAIQAAVARAKARKAAIAAAAAHPAATDPASSNGPPESKAEGG